MDSVARLGIPFCWISSGEAIRQPSLTRGAFLVTLAVAAIFAWSSQRTSVALLSRWTFFSKPSLTEDEIKDLAATSKKYSPREFAERLYTYIEQNPSKNPQNSQPELEWLEKLNSNTDFKSDACLIYPSYQEKNLLNLEDEKAAVLQTWATQLQPLVALLREGPILWESLLDSIQSSPRLAYTILFNCLAPITARAVWNAAHDFSPHSFQEIEAGYWEHKGKIALLCLGIIVWLYYKMSQEKGIITNVTENFALFNRAHMGLDLIPSYKACLGKLLRSIALSSPGQSSSSVIWYYNEKTQSTFKDKIGEAIAEMTATGRICDHSDLVSQFPQLKKLRVLELNLRNFLIEYRDKKEVYRGWQQTLKHLAKSSDALVFITGFDAILPYLSAPTLQERSSEGRGREDSNLLGEPNSEKILAELILRSLRDGSFRCLIALSEENKAKVEGSSSVAPYFSFINAPNVNAEELKQLCTRLYTAPDAASPFKPKEIERLFLQMEPVLSKTPLSPLAILEVVQRTFRERASSWRLKNLTSEEISQIERAERNLYEAQKTKEELLQKFWEERRFDNSHSSSLERALLLVEKVVTPLYGKEVILLKKDKLKEMNLISEMQKKFGRLFGRCTAEEEAKLQALPEKLKEKIIGQDDAIDAVCKAVYKWRKVPPENGTPLVLLFAGPSGVGKSQTAAQLAFSLNDIYGIKESAARSYGSNVKTVNLNRLQQGGVWGWDNVKAQILGHLIEEPASVILFEEWDKMSEEERASPLELLDGTNNYLQESWQRGVESRQFVDTSCAIFIFTANPSEETELSAKGIEKWILQIFEKGENANAFLSRMNALIPFQNISENQNIINKCLNYHLNQGTLSREQSDNIKEELSEIELADGRAIQRIVEEEVFKKIISNSIN
jgi:DNA polymerase III delta prime subunit